MPKGMSFRIKILTFYMNSSGTSQEKLKVIHSFILKILIEY